MEYSLRFAGFSACGALLTMTLSLLGLLTPWWTDSEPDELAPIITEVSLWTSNTRFTLRMDGGVETHTGCDYRCNKARFTKPRVYSKCQTWEDMRDWAPQLCRADIGSRAEYFVTTTTALPRIYGPNGVPYGVDGTEDNNYNFDKEADPDVFQNPDLPYTLKPAVPPNTVQISTHKPNSFGAPTTTVTAFFTWTTTVVTTSLPRAGQTTEMTPIPVATTPMLGAAFCEQPTWEERLNAPYTEWELNFDLGQVIIERIYTQLYPFLTEVPKYMFTQRPLRQEQVRLVWEAYVGRSEQTKWLGRYPCPSVPARQLHQWIYDHTTDPFLVALGEQGLMPPNVKPVEWSDWALKEAWELELLGITTTTRQTLALLEARTTRPAEITSPEPSAAPPLPAEPEPYAPDVTSFIACHLATFDQKDDPEGPFAWYEMEDPCSVAGNFEKVWISKGCLFMAIVLSMGHGFPAAVLFINSKHRFAWRFPGKVGMMLALGVAFLQVVSVISASTLVVTAGLNGIGFWSTILGIICSLFTAGCSKLSEAASNSEQPQAPATASVAMGRIQVDPWSLQTAAQVAWDNDSKKSLRRVYPQS